MGDPVQDPKHPAIPEPSPDPVGTVTAILIGQLGSPYFFITFFLIILPLKHQTHLIEAIEVRNHLFRGSGCESSLFFFDDFSASSAVQRKEKVLNVTAVNVVVVYIMVTRFTGHPPTQIHTIDLENFKERSPN